MIEVTKQIFYNAFKNLNVTTGCPLTYKIWEVRLKSNNQLIGKEIDGVFYIIETL